MLRPRSNRGYPRRPPFHVEMTQPIRKRKPTTKSLDKRVKTINRMIDLKWSDVGAVIVADDTIATVNANALLLNGMAQGTSAITRLGDRITATSLQIRYFAFSDADNINTTHIRVLVVLDNQTNAAAPDIGANNDVSILDASVVTLLYNAPYNHRTADRYKILHDKRMDFNPLMAGTTTPASGIVTAVVPISHSKYFKRNMHRQLKYNGAGATVADIVSGSIFIFVITDFAANEGSVNFGSRFYYKDC